LKDVVKAHEMISSVRFTGLRQGQRAEAEAEELTGELLSEFGAIWERGKVWERETSPAEIELLKKASLKERNQKPKPDVPEDGSTVGEDASKKSREVRKGTAAVQEGGFTPKLIATDIAARIKAGDCGAGWKALRSEETGEIYFWHEEEKKKESICPEEMVLAMESEQWFDPIDPIEGLQVSQEHAEPTVPCPRGGSLPVTSSLQMGRNEALSRRSNLTLTLTLIGGRNPSL